ncbi:MAG TPA: hypothetical protein VN648_06830, partial [Candidatus Methylomirabilis sp.]|nr:hypothetical protein [Candidatus Methylomirabilis sp.]
ATNFSSTNAGISITDTLPSQLQAVANTAVGGTISSDLKTVSFQGSLTPAPNISVTTGASPAGGYLNLGAAPYNVPPIPGVGDETITTFGVPAYTYAGESYTRLSVDSNGYLIVGGGTTNAFINQNLPDPAPPNNVLAPWWTDLFPGTGGGGNIYIAEVINTTTGSKWIVVDYNAVMETGTTKADSFEVWIGEGTTQDISYAYGPLGGNGTGGLLTVGAEDKFGTRGQNYYFKGLTGTAVGTLPTSTTQLVVASGTGAPTESHTITFDAVRVQPGKWINYVHMTSDQFQGIEVFAAPWPVKPLFLPVILRH